jgi:hypothetical protein
LAHEKSPYLLQHALNPVDWYPWTEEAFRKARREDLPVFLSIGYSTCHWCHVMARESFEDKTVAKLLNAHFVSIKVDREERPDIDHIYMKLCVLMTGSGGWPLTIIMTPQKKPFFAGTYLPKYSRPGMTGLVDLLKKVVDLWKRNRGRLLAAADSATGSLSDSLNATRGGDELTELTLDEGFLRLLDSFDRRNGGFGTRPKFPSPHNLLFLLRYWKRRGREQALEMVEKTLQQMRIGGIFDQVGFGFHRYSTDVRWRVPHFEKMLYDQAMMALAYTEAYQATGAKQYQETAEQTFEYVQRDLTSPGGAFFSAEDADSEGREGKFYVWTAAELKQVLGEKAALLLDALDISKDGNFSEAAHKGRTGQNILSFQEPWPELSAKLGIKLGEFTDMWSQARQKLLQVRDQRVHPFKDDKILVDWNGLMIAALARAGQAFGSPRLSAAAEQAVRFLLGSVQTSDGRLLHQYRDGEAAVDGTLDDYAFLVWGLTELYEATFETRYLEEALRLQGDLLDRFWDDEDGGFFFTSDDSEQVLIRHKEFRDGAVPCGNSIAFLNLLRLSRMTGRPEYEDRAATLAKVISAHEGAAQVHSTMFLTGLDFLLGPTYEIVVVGDPESRETKTMLRAIRTCFVPNKVLLFKNVHHRTLETVAAFTKNMEPIDGKPAAYICRDFTCSKPTTEVQDVLTTLTKPTLA